MRWLPIEFADQDDRVAIRLPCLEADLVKFVAICASKSPVEGLHRLLRSNPTLLLFSLGYYRESLQQVPSSARELIEVISTNGLDAMSVVRIGYGSGIHKKCSEKKLGDWFVEFSRARSNKKLRRSLEQFIQLFGFQKKRQGKNLILSLVGRDLRADQFVCSGIRRKENSGRLTRRWLGERGSELPIEALIKLGKKTLETSASHEQRLQRDKLASMKQLAYGASHEINNPLANIASRAPPVERSSLLLVPMFWVNTLDAPALRLHKITKGIKNRRPFLCPPAITAAPAAIG